MVDDGRVTDSQGRRWILKYDHHHDVEHRFTILLDREHAGDEIDPEAKELVMGQLRLFSSEF